MARAKGDGMSPGEGWQPGCQASQKPPRSSEVATRLPLQEPTPEGFTEAGLISNGNQVATQEGR